MRETDESLLLAFATHRDEAAFRQVAERYLGLIFHTALRRTGNRQMAEDVSQHILCAIARKAAPLARKPGLLPSWIHRATLYESSKAMRSELSQQKRRSHLAAGGEDPRGNPVWDEALPHLDIALDKLPDEDRRVLLLHYFENQSFPVIARSLGKSTAAIQKQSQRALEKLARMLRGRGVALSAAAIATGLGSELAKAAPVSLIQSATAGALAGSAAYSTHGLTLMFAMKSKAAIPVALVLCAAPLIFQQVAISRAEYRLADLAAARSEERHRSAAPSSKPSARSAAGVSTSRDILVLIDECDMARRTWGLPMERFQQKLSSFTPDALEALIRECVSINTHRERRNNLLAELAFALTEKDAERAARFLFEAVPDGPDFAHTLDICNHRRSLALWAQRDPDAALAWIREIEQNPKFAGHQTVSIDLRENLREPMLNALVLRHHPELEAFLLALPEMERSGLIFHGIEHAASYGSMRTNERMGAEAADILPGYLPLIRKHVFENSRNAALEAVVGRFNTFPGNQLADIRSFYTKAAMTPDERETMAVMIASRMLSFGSRVDQAHLQEPASRELNDWLGGAFGDEAAAILAKAGEIARREEENRAAWVIRSLTEGSHSSDQRIAEDLTRYNMRSHMPEALKLAERIKDPDLRKDVAGKLHQQSNPRPNP